MVCAPGGWHFDLRGVGEPYWVPAMDGDQKLAVRVCDEAAWYAWQAGGSQPVTEAWFANVAWIERPEG